MLAAVMSRVVDTKPISFSNPAAETDLDSSGEGQTQSQALSRRIAERGPGGLNMVSRDRNGPQQPGDARHPVESSLD
jgi:hypothetical protein